MAEPRLRELPRFVVGAIVVAAVLFGVGLLIGDTVGSTHAVRAVTSTVTHESPAQAAQIQAQSTTIASDNAAIVTLSNRLGNTRRRLANARRAIRIDERRLNAGRRGPGG